MGVSLVVSDHFSSLTAGECDDPGPELTAGTLFLN